MLFELMHYYMVIFLPFVGFLAAILNSFIEIKAKKKINSLFVASFIIFCTLTSFLFSLKLFLRANNFYMNGFDIKSSVWIDLSSLYSESFISLNWGFLFDTLSVVMLIVITSVSTLVQIYSIGYMAHDPNRAKFMGYLSLFVFFMLVLVTADNYLQMFIGWEGVGLVSYLLINFWFTRVEAAKSALKAVSVNKLGDYGLVMAICLFFYYFKTVDYLTIFQNTEVFVEQHANILYFNIDIITFIAFFLILAAVGKSAQLGLHTWLPDAMEGPTPVSALIHAATMVTAGVYLIVRSSPFIEFSPLALAIIAIIGATTALFGATTALFQNDLKKVIAYSTCSQLGYMFLACGLSSYGLAMFHLFNHAFFKALLFLCAGAIIHAMGDEQDMRRMGGLAQLLPFTYVVMTIGNFSLMGFPFLSGYFSKDLILETAATNFSVVGYYCYTLGLLAAGFTALYSAKLTYLTFWTKPNAYYNVIKSVHEVPSTLFHPLWILAILSIVSGYIFEKNFVGYDNLFWGQSIYVNLINLAYQADVHSLEPAYKLLPTVLSVFSFFVLLLCYDRLNYFFSKLFLNSRVLRSIYYFFNKKWYFDIVYTTYIIKPFYYFSYFFVFKAIDRGFLNTVFLVFPVSLGLFVGKFIKKLHSGYIYFYIFIGILAVVLYLFFRSL
jgi:proton-translocating NADH-quinone oxidoreductase chain L